MNIKDSYFGILSTKNNPLLPFYINKIISKKIKNIIIIYDKKKFSKFDQVIWKERTNGYFENELKNNLNIKKKLEMVQDYTVKNHNDRDALELYKKLNIVCLLNAGTPRKLSKSLIKNMKLGIINIHPGILPHYRGCTAVEWSIYNNDQVGNSAHFIDDGYDTGPLIDVESYLFKKNSSYQDIRIKVYSRGCRLAAEILFKINNNDLFIKKAKPQNNLKGKYWSPISKKNMQLVYKRIKNKKYKYQTL